MYSTMRVKCIKDDQCEYITAGRIYEAKDLGGDWLQIKVCDNGQLGEYFSCRFEVVPEETPNTGTLPTDAKARKNVPICTGVLDYFPDALAAIAEVSRVGNEQHNPGQPLHWARGKSMDQEDALMRHLLDRGKLDTDGLRHSAKVAWRALALLQLEIEKERGK